MKHRAYYILLALAGAGAVLGLVMAGIVSVS